MPNIQKYPIVIHRKKVCAEEKTRLLSQDRLDKSRSIGIILHRVVQMRRQVQAVAAEWITSIAVGVDDAGKGVTILVGEDAGEETVVVRGTVVVWLVDNVSWVAVLDYGGDVRADGGVDGRRRIAETKNSSTAAEGVEDDLGALKVDI